MYQKQKHQPTNLRVTKHKIGETIEQKIRRIVNNKEPITDGAPIVYTERKEGVRPEFDIRTDRFDIAIDAMDKVAKTHVAKRDKTMGEQAKEGMEKEGKTDKPGDGGAEPTQGTKSKGDN